MGAGPRPPGRLRDEPVGGTPGQTAPHRATGLAPLLEPLARWSDEAREAIIRARLSAILATAGSAGVAVTCGMNHAQKETLMGPVSEVVGTWLARHPEAYGGDAGSLRAVAFTGARGSRLSHFDDAVPWTYDLATDDPANSLSRILAEAAGERLAWLPLSDPIFTSAAVKVDWGRDVHILPVGKQFDGLVLYPAVSVLRSLSMP